MSIKIKSDPHDARKSQFWNTNGGHERKTAETLKFERRHGTDPLPWWMVKDNMSYERASEKGLVPQYEEGKRYRKHELEWMANDIIFKDPNWDPSDGYILSPWVYKDRLRREIYTDSGTPLPHIVEGLYWRTHPQGRKVNSDEQRKKNRQGFYR